MQRILLGCDQRILRGHLFTRPLITDQCIVSFLERFLPYSGSQSALQDAFRYGKTANDERPGDSRPKL
jgi:hypothetical protein